MSHEYDFVDLLLTRSLGPDVTALQPRPAARFEGSYEPIRDDAPVQAISAEVPALGQRAQPTPMSAPLPIARLDVAPLERESLRVEQRVERESVRVHTVDSLLYGDAGKPVPLLTAPVPARSPTLAKDVTPAEQAEPSAPAATLSEERTAREPLPAVVPRAEPLDDAAFAGAPERSDASEPATLVRVTIGRVEISAPSEPRAARVPSPPRRVVQAARPVRPLDDYLRQRGEGRR